MPPAIVAGGICYTQGDMVRGILYRLKHTQRSKSKKYENEYFDMFGAGV